MVFTTGRHRRVAGLLLAAFLSACATENRDTVRPEGFVDVLDTIGRLCADASNTYECARAVEQYRLAKGVPGVTRVGRRLSLAVKSGAVVDLTDGTDASAEDYVAYAYIEHLACFGQHLLHRQFAEGDDYVLVHVDSGARLEIASVPILAPDCQRLVVVSGLPEGSLVQVWRLADSGRAVLEWGYEPEESPWMPGTPVWKDPMRLDIPYVTEADQQTRRTLSARLYTDGWRVER